MAVPLQPIQPQAIRQPSQKEYEETFRYQRLETQSTFRLLKLHRGRGDKINCSLHHYELDTDDRPSYRAISYTWGEDAARSNIHLLPGSSVMKVRPNLRNALRAVRDEATDCFLWIDAICINQSSDEERNLQVRLMADIYGQANNVIVWLQSAGEKTDVARAFDFVSATYNSTDRMYRSLREYSLHNEHNWRSVQKLCRMRYWTRKWIIQELILANSVVLRIDSLEYPMGKLEAFCSRLQHIRSGDDYEQLTRAKRSIVKSVIASPAGRLTLQRFNSAGLQQMDLLYQLVIRYAANECKMHCDHVYALYSLVGEHRSYLSIDYAATAVQRLVSVLDFVDEHEALPPKEVLAFSDLLVDLFKIQPKELERGRRLLQTLVLETPFTLLGAIESLPESEAAIKVRKTVDPLPPMRTFLLDTSQDTWLLTPTPTDVHVATSVGRPDMHFFRVSHSSLYGLAACRVQPGDAIWHLAGTRLGFVVRQSAGGRRATILGRSYLYRAAPNNGPLESWLRRPSDHDSTRRFELSISIHLGDLLELGSLAILIRARSGDSKRHVDKSPLLKHVTILWRGNWTSILIAVSSSRSNSAGNKARMILSEYS